MLLLFSVEVLLLLLHLMLLEHLLYLLFGLFVGYRHRVDGLGKVVGREGRLGRGRGPLVVS